MQTSKNVKSLTEVKLMQRHINCDLNVVLLYSLLIMKIKHEDLDVRLGSQLEKNFIAKCFYCGCTTGKSGVVITCFIIQKASFVTIFSRIIQEIKPPTENMVNQMIAELLRMLLKGLNSWERILVYDSTVNRFTELTKGSNLMKYVESFHFFKKAYVPVNEADDLFTFYNDAKTKINDRIKIYYTLYDDDIPVIPKAIINDFIFCKKTDRTYAGCVSNSYLKKIKTSILKNDKKFTELYNYVE